MLLALLDAAVLLQDFAASDGSRFRVHFMERNDFASINQIADRKSFFRMFDKIPVYKSSVKNFRQNGCDKHHFAGGLPKGKVDFTRLQRMRSALGGSLFGDRRAARSSSKYVTLPRSAAGSRFAYSSNRP
jgi:hypothetical protein